MRARKALARLEKPLSWLAEKGFVILVVLVFFKLPAAWTFELNSVELQRIEMLSGREGEDVVLKIDLELVKSINGVELEQRKGRLSITAPDVGIPCSALRFVPQAGRMLSIEAGSAAAPDCGLHARWVDHGPRHADGPLQLELAGGTSVFDLLGPLEVGGVAGELAGDPPFFCPRSGVTLEVQGWGIELASLRGDWTTDAARLQATVNAWLPWRVSVGHTSCLVRALWK